MPDEKEGLSGGARRDRTVDLLHAIFAPLDSDYAALPPGQKFKGAKPIGRRIQLAMWICLSTLCRIGELMQAEWSHVDLDAATWLIPAPNTKGRRRQRQDHHVFLSRFLVLPRCYRDLRVRAFSQRSWAVP
ncbi:MAG: tyrosine-type recombinase/integrase [Pseudomonadales bacterium]